MNKRYRHDLGRGGHRFRQLLLIAGAVIAMVVFQACGNAAGTGNSGQAGSGKSGDSAVAAAGKPAGNIPSTLNYGYIGANKLNLPGTAEGWGLYKGIIQAELKKYGITEVKLTGFPNGPDQTESLISGRLDFGSLGDTPAIIAYASGAKTRLISQPSTQSIGYLFGKKDGPQSVAELQGKTIAIQKGSFMHRYVAGLLKAEGVKDVKLVHMLSPDAIAALARGDVDAISVTGVPAHKLIEEGYPLLDNAASHPDLRGSSVTIVSDDYLAKFPDFPKVWNAAREKALADLKLHEEEYYQFLTEVNSTTSDVARKVFPISILNAAAFTEEGLQLLDGTKNFLVEEKLAKKDFKIADWQLK